MSKVIGILLNSLLRINLHNTGLDKVMLFILLFEIKEFGEEKDGGS